MKITLYALAIDTFAPVLSTLAGLLEKGAAHARAEGTNPAALTQARLAPDMFPLSTQVQLACHHAKDGTARLSGAAPPKIENKELTLDQLEALVKRTATHLRGIKETAFAGAEDRVIEMPLQGSTVFKSNGIQFLRDWSIPNFYFHVVTAYDILRNSGVEVGKRDYLKHIGPYLRQRGDS
ncbi:MAG: DUF1993 domain-containing protein [Steroidobacteraceae bacterium]